VYDVGNCKIEVIAVNLMCYNVLSVDKIRSAGNLAFFSMVLCLILGWVNVNGL
jgi:hypothetical protein